jgi:hypothetical protein
MKNPETSSHNLEIKKSLSKNRKGNTARSFFLEVEYFVISVAQLVNTENS